MRGFIWSRLDRKPSRVIHALRNKRRYPDGVEKISVHCGAGWSNRGQFIEVERPPNCKKCLRAVHGPPPTGGDVMDALEARLQ